MKHSFLLFLLLTLSLGSFNTFGQEIPIEELLTQRSTTNPYSSSSILQGEINGINIEHITINGKQVIKEQTQVGHKTIYLFFKGNGTVVAAKENYEIVPETILLPNSLPVITVKTNKKDTLHYLKISSKLTEQDLLDLKEFPTENTQNVYYAKFTDCEPYTEAIKSPNTVSRTILPNKYIPRIAMGTVQTKGPDKVDPHEHPMLEQLFLGLTDNDVIVYADDAQVDFPQYSLLHIPLGSSHSVTVDENKIMYYVWMDFFMDKKGEEWLNTHKAIKEE
ncbi:hypothetical protein N6H18_12315 [Reichenbachiella agarivorans]|uniref:Cupin domain-containing protein n=1 Tax=Reichenbachiella agarivorans TaxID=2979464 RepID=A0ABY6CNU3_9BACT|nr:hypothetical protein [Reichenbachiella agarivorans]UXP31133.1 hypothetical protein N6H18_12315 [Reichenbachiella agarivorans]